MNRWKILYQRQTLNSAVTMEQVVREWALLDPVLASRMLCAQLRKDLVLPRAAATPNSPSAASVQSGFRQWSYAQTLNEQFRLDVIYPSITDNGGNT